MNIRHRFIHRAYDLDFRGLAGRIAVITCAGRVVDIGFAARIRFELHGQLDFMERTGCNVAQLQGEHLVCKAPLIVQDAVHIDVILQHRRYHRRIQRVFQHDIFPRFLAVVANNNRKSRHFLLVGRALADVYHRLIYVFRDIKAGGVSRVLRLHLRDGHTVVGRRAAAVVTGHGDAVLQHCTSRFVKHLYIEGHGHALACREVAH